MPGPPTLSMSRLHVRPWPDPVIDEVGYDVRSPYVERFWLPVLGPTASWLIRRLVTRLDEAPDGFELDLALTATELGLGTRTGRHSPFLRSIDRCCRYGAAHLVDEETLRVRRKLPPLTRLQLVRLPEAQQEAHRTWVEPPPPSLPPDQVVERARGLALSLLELGEDGEAAERQLHTWRLHPAVAHDAVAWAQQRRSVSRSVPRGDLPPEAA